MTIKKIVAVAVSAMGVMALSSTAYAAAPIFIFSTGVDNSGNLLAPGAVDNHWVLLPGHPGAPFATDPAVNVAINGPQPLGTWFNNTPFSQWIVPDNNAPDVPSSNVLVYDYQQTFTAPSAGLTNFRATADNSILDVLVNGVSTGFSYHVGTDDAFFTISPPFVFGYNSGVNTIDFIVHNNTNTATNPNGLNVQMGVTVVPEGSTLSLIGAAGLLAVGMIRRRTRR